MKPEYKVILLLPTYNGWSRNRQCVVNFARNLNQAGIIEISSSALGHCFNIGFQLARKEANEGRCTHVIMLHADIVVKNGSWGTDFVEEMDRVGAGIMSVVIPIKTQEGITSTAVETKETQDKNGWHPVRFTMKEIAQMPETFTHPRLMLNTGLMCIDMRQDWVNELVFDLESKVDLANYRPFFLPEDWKMSRFCQEKKVSMWATTKIKAIHIGEAPFGNDKPWGTKASEGALEIYQQEGYDAKPEDPTTEAYTE